MDRSFNARNDASRKRLADVLGRLSDAALERPLDAWSGAAILAHLAFWDRMVLVRWEHAAREGLRTPITFDSPVTDLINDSQMAEWSALPTGLARELAVSACAACDAHVAQLDDAAVQAAIDAGHLRLVDRSVHRTMHLDALEAAVAAPR